MFTNKSKIKEYSQPHSTAHKQVIIKGIRNDNSKFELICDNKIADLIYSLNLIGCRTLWSCQGGKRDTPYIVISGGYLTKTRLDIADQMIRDFWKKKFPVIEIKIWNGDIAWYGHRYFT